MRCGWLTFGKPSPLIGMALMSVSDKGVFLSALAFQFFSGIIDKRCRLKGLDIQPVVEASVPGPMRRYLERFNRVCMR